MPISEALLCFSDWRLLLFGRPLISEVDVDVDKGLGGRLLTLVILGGTGNAPTLVVFLNVFPGVGRADEDDEVLLVFAVDVEAVFSVGTAGVECVLPGLGVGNPDAVTERVIGLDEATDEAAEGGL